MMTGKILAICLGPILLRSEKEGESGTTTTIASKAGENGDYRAIETMIDKWSACFAEEKMVSLFGDSGSGVPPPSSTPPPPSTTPPAGGSGGDSKDGAVTAADAAAWLKKFQVCSSLFHLFARVECSACSHVFVSCCIV